MPLLHASWKPAARMKRIITHWTAGAYTASTNDKEHYHILVERDGNLVRGDHSIDDNERIRGDDYAAHTRRLNTGSIGISVCCMAGARESPFRGGEFPMTERQWLKLAAVAAELATFYNIPVTRLTILGHGEVQRTLGVPQNGKWDPMVLPWNRGLTKAQVGDAFRAEVTKRM